MERGQAIAWAGSVTLAGFAVAFMVGSLVSGFDPDGSHRPPTQTIAPNPTPGNGDAEPPLGGDRAQPAPKESEPDAGAQTPDGRLAREVPSAGLLPGTGTVLVSLPTWTAPAHGSGDVAASPHDPGKGDTPEGIDKKPSSSPDNVSRDISVIKGPRRTVSPSPVRDIADSVPGFANHPAGRDNRDEEPGRFQRGDKPGGRNTPSEGGARPSRLVKLFKTRSSQASGTQRDGAITAADQGGRGSRDKSR
jgi:hypothetical protein